MYLPLKKPVINQKSILQPIEQSTAIANLLALYRKHGAAYWDVVQKNEFSFTKLSFWNNYLLKQLGIESDSEEKQLLLIVKTDGIFLKPQ